MSNKIRSHPYGHSCAGHTSPLRRDWQTFAVSPTSKQTNIEADNRSKMTTEEEMPLPLKLGYINCLIPNCRNNWGKGYKGRGGLTQHINDMHTADLHNDAKNHELVKQMAHEMKKKICK